jgi:NADP-dependent 3-hydroxy acid dehydrogenase YdfG
MFILNVSSGQKWLVKPPFVFFCYLNLVTKGYEKMSYTISCNADLAIIVGVNEGMFLKKLQYWLGKSENWVHGRLWVYNTYKQWHEQFPHISERTLRRTINMTDTDSIKKSIADGLSIFRQIDVLVNNAGFYTIGVLEAATNEQIQRQLGTNLLGLINMTKEILPHFRKHKSGMIINLSSVAGRTTVPLQSLYHATKWGVEGFSESLQYEVRPFNIKVKIIEPGVIKTDFYGRSMTIAEDKGLKEYQDYSKKVTSNLVRNGNDAPILRKWQI